MREFSRQMGEEVRKQENEMGGVLCCRALRSRKARSKEHRTHDLVCTEELVHPKFTVNLYPSPPTQDAGFRASAVFLLSTVQRSGHNSRIPYLFFLGAFVSFSCRCLQYRPLCRKQRILQSSLPGGIVSARQAQI